MPVGEGMGGAGAGPTLQPREIKVEKPSKFSGKHSELNNFVFEMKQYVETPKIFLRFDRSFFLLRRGCLLTSVSCSQYLFNY